MFARYALTVFAALGVSALPHSKPLESRQTQDGADTYSTLSRLNPTYTDSQLQQIKLAYTEVDRLKLIRSFGDPDDYFKFDFTKAGFTSNAGNGLGGQGYLAAVQNYPALMGTGLSMAIGYLNPCGLDSSHVHNRATEFVLLVSGKTLLTGFTLEDGFNESVTTTLGLFQGTIRPQGSIHWEFNDNCEPAIFVAGLSSEDPGVARTAQNFFKEVPDLVDAELGFPKFLNGVDVGKYANYIPKAFGLGAANCLKRCGIPYNTTDF